MENGQRLCKECERPIYKKNKLAIYCRTECSRQWWNKNRKPNRNLDRPKKPRHKVLRSW